MSDAVTPQEMQRMAASLSGGASAGGDAGGKIGGKKMAAALGSLGKKVSGVFAKAGSRARMAPGEGQQQQQQLRWDEGARGAGGQF